MGRPGTYDTNGAFIVPDDFGTAQTVSQGQFIGGNALVGIIAPASMAGSSLTFEVSPDGATWYTLRDDLGTLVSVTLNAAAAFYSLSRIIPFAVPYIRTVSSSAETSKTIQYVAQKVVV